MYRLSSRSTIRRLTDNVFIPVDPANADYREYLLWLSAGNTAEQESEPTPPLINIFDGAEFLARLTDAEYGAILAAAGQSVQLARWLDIFRLRGEIDVTGATAQAAKAGLVGAKLLTQARADVIFATE